MPVLPGGEGLNSLRTARSSFSLLLPLPPALSVSILCLDLNLHVGVKELAFLYISCVCGVVPGYKRDSHFGVDVAVRDLGIERFH
ncbi:hypothetical protein BP00DRAFT_430692 [Aspergillus indologenus CBS 114.80]|uniref:Uncharacterized protein n=1 Tax=Aspergillus indologenus CBS 114.80 TaxID=1450541 RepID=A0A2V5HQH0_9EURO|nr:hypothetical protein BP00DRAFT_430692 [Aspergillus indologenus CBS 114.80]